MNARTGSHARFVNDREALVLELPEGWRDTASPGRGVARALPVRGGVAPLGLPSWGGVTSLCARTRGEPSSAHCEQRLSDGSPLARAIPCAPAPEYGVTREKEKSGSKAGKTMQPTSERQPVFLSPPPHAAQRAVPGWRGGLGRVGADLASAGSMRPPPSPARHVSTAWLATAHVRQ